MDKIEIEKKRLERCKDCKCPTKDGGCPGNSGIGCIADWRCCKEFVSVCTDCHDCDSDCMTYENCDKLNCEKMKNFREK